MSNEFDPNFANFQPRARKNLDEMDERIYAWEEAVEKWQEAQIEYNEAEGMFKAWEASQKTALMGMKMSATSAESRVKASDQWAERYIEVQNLAVMAETKKRIMRIAEAKWETQRSKEASLRNVR